MYKPRMPKGTSIKRNNSYEGETIETKVMRMLSNKEPITDTAPLIYTDRKDGVRPEFDIRTDKMELAAEGASIKAEQTLETRLKKIGDKAKEGMKKEGKTTDSNPSGEVKD